MPSGLQSGPSTKMRSPRTCPPYEISLSSAFQMARNNQVRKRLLTRKMLTKDAEDEIQDYLYSATNKPESCVPLGSRLLVARSSATTQGRTADPSRWLSVKQIAF